MSHPAVTIQRKKLYRAISVVLLLTITFSSLATVVVTTAKELVAERKLIKNENIYLWLSPTLISNESTGRSLRPVIAVDSFDNIHVVWQDMTDLAGVGTDDDIFYKRWNATTEQWSATEVLSPSGSFSSTEPRIAADEHGNIHLIWKDKTNILGAGSDSDVFYRFWNKTTMSWSPIELVSSNSTAEVYSMDLTTKEGKVYVAWDDITNYLSNGPDEDILFSMRYPNGTWTEAETVSSVSDGTSRFPDIVVDKDGNVHVCWDDSGNYAGAGSDRDIFYRMKNSTTGLWGTTEVLSSTSNDNSERVKMVIAEDGDRFLIWTDASNILGAGNDDDLFYREWDSSTESWSEVTLLTGNSTGNSNVPAIALTEKNIIHVVWFDSTEIMDAGTDQDIFYCNYNRTSKEWSQYQLLTTSTADSWRPEITTDSENKLHLVYQDRTLNLAGSGSDIDIFYIKGQEKKPSPVLVIIDKPQDPSYFYEGESKKTLTWTVSDINVSEPNYSLYQEGELKETGSWVTDEPIVITLEDELEKGNYSYHFEATDGWGEFVEDDVRVMIIEKERILGPATQNALIGLAVGVAPVTLTTLIVYLRKKRKKNEK